MNRARLAYQRPGLFKQWWNVLVYSVQHVFLWFWGSFLVVFWLRGGFSGEIPPPLD